LTSNSLAEKSPGDAERIASIAIAFDGERMHCDLDGTLFWPRQRMLVVSDLHLEKGAMAAARGSLVPPYDTAVTLRRLAAAITRRRPQAVVCLGDSFHAPQASGRMAPALREMLLDLMEGLEWIWIAGNHDPAPPEIGGGKCFAEISIGGLTLHHEPGPRGAGAEICGHLHPQARIVRRGKAVRRPCFATDGTRMMLPAFGAYAGGLNIRDRAFAGLFDDKSLHAHVLGRDRLYTIGGRELV
jgi:DNA ligase-associated metallophosphoesterase